MLAARGVPVAEFNLEETPVTGMLGYLHLLLLVCMCVRVYMCGLGGSVDVWVRGMCEWIDVCRCILCSLVARPVGTD